MVWCVVRGVVVRCSVMVLYQADPLPAHQLLNKVAKEVEKVGTLFTSRMLTWEMRGLLWVRCGDAYMSSWPSGVLGWPAWCFGE